MGLAAGALFAVAHDGFSPRTEQHTPSGDLTLKDNLIGKHVPVHLIVDSGRPCCALFVDGLLKKFQGHILCCKETKCGVEKKKHLA